MAQELSHFDLIMSEILIAQPINVVHEAYESGGIITTRFSSQIGTGQMSNSQQVMSTGNSTLFI